jgi:hypothetical protein
MFIQERHVTFVSSAQMRIPTASARAVDFILDSSALEKEGWLRPSSAPSLRDYHYVLNQDYAHDILSPDS